MPHIIRDKEEDKGKEDKEEEGEEEDKEEEEEEEGEEEGEDSDENEEEDQYKEDDQEWEQNVDEEEEENGTDAPLDALVSSVHPSKNTTKAGNGGPNKVKETTKGATGPTKDLIDMPHMAGKDTSDKVGGIVGGIAEKGRGLGKSAKDAAGDTTDARGRKGDEARYDQPGQGTFNGALKQTRDARHKAQAMDQVKDAAEGAVGKAQGSASGLAAKTRGDLGQTDNRLMKEGTGDINQVSNGLPLRPIQGLAGKKVNDSGQIIDESGHVLGQASGDLASMAGKSVNDSGEIVDSGRVVGRVGDLTEKGQNISTMIHGFTPETGGSGSVNASGIQINVQTGKEGMSLNINIPRNFQRQ
jgi:hypothetical protein